ncbi:MAG: hypothetical protein AABY18_06275 [Candidatus Thermoplasmatota archaeon]
MAATRHAAVVDPATFRLRWADLAPAAATLLLVLVSGVLVVAPFLVIRDIRVAGFASRLVAAGLLFTLGATWGHASQRAPFWSGLALASVGLAIAALVLGLGH